MQKERNNLKAFKPASCRSLYPAIRQGQGQRRSWLPHVEDVARVQYFQAVGQARTVDPRS